MRRYIINLMKFAVDALGFPDVYTYFFNKLNFNVYDILISSFLLDILYGLPLFSFFLIDLAAFLLLQEFRKNFVLGRYVIFAYIIRYSMVCYFLGFNFFYFLKQISFCFFLSAMLRVKT